MAFHCPKHSLVARSSACLVGWLACCHAAHSTEPTYQRDIRPILSDKCFVCHGPDEETRQTDLRLDLKQSTMDSAVIVPGNPDHSFLFLRLISKEADHQMPPPDSGKQLTQEEIDLIRRWISAGAEYNEHWAFVAPTRPAVPAVGDEMQAHNPIDQFVLQGLHGSGLDPSPPANRTTLIRRLFLDLVGLPPSPMELAKWTALENDHWRAELIESLMSSDHFGERWGRWWLDAARYSDSDGYEKDKPRDVWFYRDWVINAMNSDMPIDQFILRQIAGDLLPDASQSDRVATGFLRNSMVNEEGGADPEQFRMEGLFDRMDAIGKSILGITTQCAQCHSHKYDPLTQEEYYGMLAALNNCHEAIATVYTPGQEVERDKILSAIAKVEDEVRNSMADVDRRLADWHRTMREGRPIWQTLKPTELPWEGQKFRPLEDDSIISESYAPTRNDISFRCDLVPGTYTALRLDLLTHPQLPHGGPGRSILGTGAITQFEFSIDEKSSDDSSQKKVAVKIGRAFADVNPPTVPLPPIYRERDALKDDRVTGGIAMALDNDPKTAWSTDNGPGRRNQDRHAVFEFESPLEVNEPTSVWVRMVQNHGGWNSDDNQNYLMGRYRFSITQHPDPAATLVPATVEPLIEREFETLSPEEKKKLFSVWLGNQEEFADANQKIEELWKQFPEGASQLVVAERNVPRETYVLERGDFLRPGVSVQPGFPKFLHSSTPSDEPARLQFARWLVDRQSPTTARVIVNRVWQAYFGQGLVSTPEDFGHQSPLPSHPELLDWLAVELMDSGWSLKHIHQLIVSSATYQQSSNIDHRQLELDRYNRLLARGPRFRLEAELVRDLGLSVSGLMNNQVGGPSVFPPAPQFLFEPPASYGPKAWPQAPGLDQYRRSLYVHSFRSVPYPPLQVFDAPKGETACVRRERSNNPLQALVLLNEPQFVEFARGLASRILRESPSEQDVDRIVYGHTLVTSRTPNQSEVDVLLQLLEQQRWRLANNELSSDELTGVSELHSKQLTGYSASQLLPWIVVARVLLNLDETITKG